MAYQDVTELLNSSRAAVSEGDKKFAGDHDEHPNCNTGSEVWEIRHKDTGEIIEYKDLQQFAKEIIGEPVEQHGIETIYDEVSGLPTSPEENDPKNYGHGGKKPKDGVGDLKKYEAQVVASKGHAVVSIPIKPIDNVNTKYNWFEPTGQ